MRTPAPAVQPVEAKIATLVAVVAIVIAAVVLDRGRFDPAPASGVVPQPGETALIVPSGSLAEDDLAPNAVLRTPDNRPVELAGLRGEVVVLHFWATWCIDCRVEVPALNGIDEQEGVTVLGVAVDEPRARTGAAADDLGMTYTVLSDPGGTVASDYGASTLPVTVVIDPGGTVRSVTTGPFDPATLQETIDAAKP